MCQQEVNSQVRSAVPPTFSFHRGNGNVKEMQAGCWAVLTRHRIWGVDQGQ